MRYSASSQELDAVGVKASWWIYAGARSLAHWINQRMWKVEVEQRWLVPECGPTIIAPVHRSFVDFFIASEATNRPLAFMAKNELWKHRLPARFLEAFGVFPVNRTGVDRRALERAEDILKAGGTLILFPEGTRRSGDTVTDLHEGVAFLAARTGAAVVPVALTGTEQIMPKGSRFPKRRPVRIVLGHPVHVSRPAVGSRIRRSDLAKATESIKEAMQSTFDKRSSE
ncbi:MAG: lysophospholipid acyltransferase family protein [Acidimicrobiales bacterium]